MATCTIHIFTHAHKYISSVHIRIYTHLYAHVYQGIFMHICIHDDTYMYECIHTKICVRVGRSVLKIDRDDQLATQARF